MPVAGKVTSDSVHLLQLDPESGIEPTACLQSRLPTGLKEAHVYVTEQTRHLVVGSFSSQLYPLKQDGTFVPSLSRSAKMICKAILALALCSLYALQNLKRKK